MNLLTAVAGFLPKIDKRVFYVIFGMIALFLLPSILKAIKSALVAIGIIKSDSEKEEKELKEIVEGGGVMLIDGTIAELQLLENHASSIYTDFGFGFIITLPWENDEGVYNVLKRHTKDSYKYLENVYKVKYDRRLSEDVGKYLDEDYIKLLNWLF